MRRIVIDILMPYVYTHREINFKTGYMMELDEYLFRNKKSQRQFAEDTGIGQVTICKLKNYKIIPNLETAMRIYKHTGGQISLHEILSPEERKKYEV